MNDIGLQLKIAREKTGVKLGEVSEDLNIKVLELENIEEGNMGCFKDIFVLKNYIRDYAKYLGLDSVKLIDEFNSYLFEYTSKIPIKEIEKKVNEKISDKTEEIKIVSPYTSPKPKINHFQLIFILIITLILLAVIIIWSVKQITIGNKITSQISYISKE